MKKSFIILKLSLIGALFGVVIRLVAYLTYKTPEIEFDGPAGLSLVLAFLSGGLLFAIVGLVLAVKNKF